MNMPLGESTKIVYTRMTEAFIASNYMKRNIYNKWLS